MDNIFEILLHTDDALLTLASKNVNEAYLLLFTLIMLETGLLFFPLLPGDGLLFSAGVVAVSTDMNILILVILLLVAAVAGNVINYYVGKFLGMKIRRSNNYFVKKYLMKYISKAQEFYSKHGGSAVIIGRFFPIIRTYIPFLAGVVNMERVIFLRNSIIGAFAWIVPYLLIGFFVGEIEWVKNNYGIIFLFLISTTFLPFIFKIVKRALVRFYTNK